MMKINLIEAQRSLAHKIWRENSVLRRTTKESVNTSIYLNMLFKVEQNIKDTLNNSVLYSIWQHVSRKTVSIDEKT